MVLAEEALRIYQILSKHGIRLWFVGGWGIDALLGEQTRPHKDIDVIMLLDEVNPMCSLLKDEGFNFAYLWPENRPAVDQQGIEIATAFVLTDGEGREIDVHALVLDVQGNGIPAWEEAEDFIFSKEALAGKGIVAGCVVQCISPEMQVRCHQGYAMPEKQLQDLELLHKKFGVG